MTTAKKSKPRRRTIKKAKPTATKNLFNLAQLDPAEMEQSMQQMIKEEQDLRAEAQRCLSQAEQRSGAIQILQQILGRARVKDPNDNGKETTPNEPTG